MNEALARTLYDQKLSDKEIAIQLDINHFKIWRWRHKNNLPANYDTNSMINKSHHYSRDLTPAQALEMHKFLVTLLRFDKIARDNGVKPDLSRFMGEWRGYVTSYEDRKLVREWHRRKKELA